MDPNNVPSLVDGIPADQARRILFQKIQQLEHSLADHKSQLNMYTPVAKLPTEILLRIFTSLTNDGVWPVDSTKCIPATHVCRRWRSVALNAPALWTRLLCKSTQGTIAMLERSKALPIIVHLTSSSDDILIPVLKQLSRIKSLTIGEWSQYQFDQLRQVIVENNSSMALPLRSLSLSSVRFHPWTIPSTTLQQMGHLRNLFLDNVHLDWSNPPLFFNLTTLRLHLLAPPTYDELITALNKMTCLKSLFLDETLSAIPFNGALGAVSAHLPNLDSLVIRKASIEAIRSFLALVDIPKTLRIFNILDVVGILSTQKLHKLYQDIDNYWPSLCSRCVCMNVFQQNDDCSSDGVHDGTIVVECFTTLRNGFFAHSFNTNLQTDPADIRIEFVLFERAFRREEFANALNFHNVSHLAHITHLRIDWNHFEQTAIFAMLDRLQDLQGIHVSRQIVVYFFQALYNLQSSPDKEEAPVLSKLVEIHVCDEDSRRKGPEAWQVLKTFLEQRQALQLGLHKLCIERCAHVSTTMAEDLKNCVGELCWDGPYKSRWEHSEDESSEDTDDEDEDDEDGESDEGDDESDDDGGEDDEDRGGFTDSEEGGGADSSEEHIGGFTDSDEDGGVDS